MLLEYRYRKNSNRRYSVMKVLWNINVYYKNIINKINTYIYNTLLN